MKIAIKRSLRHLFAFLCVLAAISICVYWVYKYRLDEDLSVITYRKFYEREYDDYPTVSLCFNNPFLTKRLAETGVNESAYLNFLTGQYFSEEMLKVNYENVTINISNYFKGYMIYYTNGTRIQVDSEKNIDKIESLTLVSYNGIHGYIGGFFKCFALGIPKVQDLLIFRILISNNIFSNGIRPTYATFRAIYHPPREFLLSGANQHWIWPYRAANESYKMRFIIGSNTIMIKRNKKNHRCTDSYENYDDLVLERYKNDAKCNIPYQKPDNLLPMCNNTERKKRALLSSDIVERQHMEMPCKTMEGIDVKHFESPMATPKGEHVGHFWFSVMFQQRTFTEIEQKR